MAKKNKDTETKKVTELSQRELDRLAIKAQRHTVKKVEVKEVEVTKEVIKEVKRTFEVDHIVITQFRNDDTQPTLFANVKGEFISIDDKKGFQEANAKDRLKLTLEEATEIMKGIDKKDETINVSPAFTGPQFKALIAE